MNIKKFNIKDVNELKKLVSNLTNAAAEITNLKDKYIDAKSNDEITASKIKNDLVRVLKKYNVERFFKPIRVVQKEDGKGYNILVDLKEEYK